MENQVAKIEAGLQACKKSNISVPPFCAPETVCGLTILQKGPVGGAGCALSMLPASRSLTFAEASKQVHANDVGKMLADYDEEDAKLLTILKMAEVEKEDWTDRWINTVSIMPRTMKLSEHDKGNFPCYYLGSLDPNVIGATTIRHGRAYHHYYGRWEERALCCPFPFFLSVKVGMNQEQIKLLHDCFQKVDLLQAASMREEDDIILSPEQLQKVFELLCDQKILSPEQLQKLLKRLPDQKKDMECTNIGIQTKEDLQVLNADILNSLVFQDLPEEHFPEEVKKRLIAEMEMVGWITKGANYVLPALKNPENRTNFHSLITHIADEIVVINDLGARG